MRQNGFQLYQTVNKRVFSGCAFKTGLMEMEKKNKTKQKPTLEFERGNKVFTGHKLVH